MSKLKVIIEAQEFEQKIEPALSIHGGTLYETPRQSCTLEDLINMFDMKAFVNGTEVDDWATSVRNGDVVKILYVPRRLY